MAIPIYKVKVYNASDYTYFQKRDTVNDKREPAPRERLSLDIQAKIIEGAKTTGTARVLACKCYAGEHLSVTVRCSKPKSGQKYVVCANTDKRNSAYAPKDKRNPKFAFTMSAVAKWVDELVFRGDSKPHGVIVVSGSTDSGKSELARALVHLRLQHALTQPRRPHLITIEDPIETYYYPGNATKPFLDPKTSQKYGLDYTPRELRVDTHSLKDALHDALRQTPSVVYVGEVRDHSDWREIFQFAGSGHLVVTTSHAGKLTEAIEILLKANEAKSPSERQYVADKILGVVHLRRFQCEKRKRAEDSCKPNCKLCVGNHPPKGVLLPTLWRRTAAGANSLVADGVSSVLPHLPGDSNDDVSSFGRSWFARELTKTAAIGHICDKEIKEIECKALEWDLLQE
ncbi:MAG: ATPase, T2SS/T4P/T4SS family [Armatimonadetes bacterium]|nr:ATPase, T2SS/T4P/T4SS family [Armatimonadota bacterium]